MFLSTRSPMRKSELILRVVNQWTKPEAMGIQGGFGIYVKEIRGEYTNVVGLPVGRLFYEMKKHGIELRDKQMIKACIFDLEWYFGKYTGVNGLCGK